MAGRGRPDVPGVRRASLAVMLVMALSAGVFAFSGSASAETSAVQGSAYGYYTYDIALFESPQPNQGPAPTVTLASDASNSPQDASVASAEAAYGPAVLFRSGPIDVHTEGALGADGYATSSSNVQGHPDPDQRPGPFLYDKVNSNCTANDTGVTASVTITGGVVETSYHTADDPSTPEVEEAGDPKTTEPVPTNPGPGYTVEGTLDHVGDSFRIVFNEQTTNADGTLTVNAAHLFLLGPNATGHLIIGQSVCGVTVTAPTTTTTTTVPTTTTPTTTTTVPPTKTAVPSPGDPDVVRLWGDSRITTAIALSEHTRPGGAAAVVLARESAAQEKGLQPVARIVATAAHAQEPAQFTVAPIGA
ncbi:MAG: hypothetical protein M3N52_02155, partial [Actinomycetota bacterium]|nr:hypothetical protein [Actinomycetota bacterium]